MMFERVRNQRLEIRAHEIRECLAHIAARVRDRPAPPEQLAQTRFTQSDFAFEGRNQPAVGVPNKGEREVVRPPGQERVQLTAFEIEQSRHANILALMYKHAGLRLAQIRYPLELTRRLFQLDDEVLHRRAGGLRDFDINVTVAPGDEAAVPEPRSQRAFVITVRSRVFPYDVGCRAGSGDGYVAARTGATQLGETRRILKAHELAFRFQLGDQPSSSSSIDDRALNED